MEAVAKKPLCVDLFCGLGGWAEGFLANGYDVIGFDIERRPYPAQLVLQDVLTLHGSQFRNAAVIVASPPCQAYSYRAMPWKRAKALPPPDNSLFHACFRIQREACEAAGRFIPLVVENVRGAQPWIGRAAWSYGSFYLWGDVPALMPIRFGGGRKFNPDGTNHGQGSWFKITDSKERGVKRTSTTSSWFGDYQAQKALDDAIKQGGGWWHDPKSMTRRFSSKSAARKAASAQIAKIPFPLADHIARVYAVE